MVQRIMLGVVWLAIGCGGGKYPGTPHEPARPAAPEPATEAPAAEPAPVAAAEPAPAPAAAEPAEPAAAPPELADTEAVTKKWKVKAGFGSSQSVFDLSADHLASLAIEVVDAAGTSVFRQQGFATLPGKPAAPDQCEESRVMAATERWGELSGARVSLICVNGEDVKTASEIAILVAISGAKPDARVLWAGEADVDHNEMDTCMTSHHVKYTVKGTTLTQRITDQVTRRRGAPKDCKKKKKQSTVKVQIAR